MKKPKNSMIDGDSSILALAAALVSRAGARLWSLRMRLCQMIASATGMPMRPTVSSAPRQPISQIRAAVTGGALAKPTWPVKVWIAKERPIFAGEIDPDRIA
jgi:hypothetical protein